MWKTAVKGRPNGHFAQNIYVCGVSSTYKTTSLAALATNYRVKFNDYREAVSADLKMTQDSTLGVQRYMFWLTKDMCGAPAIIDRCPVASILYQLIHQLTQEYSKIGGITESSTSYTNCVPRVMELFTTEMTDIIKTFNVLIVMPADCNMTLKTMAKRKSELDTVSLAYLYAQRDVYKAFAMLFGFITCLDSEITSGIGMMMSGYEHLYLLKNKYLLDV